MSRLFSKALVLSFLAHYLFVLMFLTLQSEHSMDESLPVLNVRIEAWDDGINRDETSLAETENDAGVPPGSAADEQPALNSRTSPFAEAGEAAVDEPRDPPPVQPRSPANREPGTAESDEIAALAATPPERRDPARGVDVAMTTIAPNEWGGSPGEPAAVAGEPHKTPVPEPDRAMLEEKFRQWSEDFHEMGDKASSLDWVHEGQTYTASFRHLPAEGEMDMGHVVVEVTKEEGGNRYATRMRMKNLSFSNYATFVNRWNPDVQFHDDISDGRFHSNSEVHLMYSYKTQPTFFGKVTTSHRRINTSQSTGRFRRKEIFLGGLETGVRKIEMPKRFSPFPGESPTESDRVRVFEADTSITFHADGSYGWKQDDSETPEQRVALSPQATYLIGAGKTTLRVKGIVAGRVLVYSPERIVIEDDLVYADPPDSVPGSEDFLGLVSDRYIEVAGPELTGPGDLLIHAAMYARRRFLVKRYTIRNLGTLEIHGSLAVGSMSATEPRYSTRIRFDKRLEDIRPPRFPVTTRYETGEWDGEWEVREIRGNGSGKPPGD